MAGSIFRKKPISNVVPDGHGHQLNKVLGVRDLTAMGIAAVIGAGVFSTIGQAAFDGGPGVSLLFVITAVTCGFSALCYAEFASRVPVSGSAYTYSYVVFGEIIAWIIGWALILEYAIGNIVVAISWSTYFNNLLVNIFNIHLPDWMLIDYSTAKAAFSSATQFMAAGDFSNAADVSKYQFAINAWNSAPRIGDMPIFFNLPAFIVVGLITWLAYIGIKESKNSANYMVVFKVAVIIFVIIAGAFFVDVSNWTPFLPNRFEGVLKGVSAVFYAYIGFDAISTTAEECKNPQRDIPRGMIYSLVICTTLYVLIALVLTGIENYSKFSGVNDPLAFVFEHRAPWIEKIVSVSAVVATTSVLLVFQLGQPRIWMSMSRDGLLPKKFQTIHPKYQTPSFATIITGILVAVPALFMESGFMTNMTSIGTLFAFVLVSGGVLMLPRIEKEVGKFRLPYINGRFIVPVLFALFVYLFRARITTLFDGEIAADKVLFTIFLVLAFVLTILTVVRKFSVIPILGVLFCSYLMIEIPANSWGYFFLWMALGLIIYFAYGYRKSKLA
ncbi:MAG: amino acid permease [Cyclobacteriaceae bacterium]